MSGVRKEGDVWVCPAGCFSKDGPPACEHTRRLDRAAHLLGEMLEEDEEDAVDELNALLEE